MCAGTEGRDLDTEVEVGRLKLIRLTLDMMWIRIRATYTVRDRCRSSGKGEYRKRQKEGHRMFLRERRAKVVGERKE